VGDPVSLYVNTANRKVWVVNSFNQDYTEEFRGEKITVPANGEKKLMMPILAAERFLGQGKYPAQYLPNGQLAPGNLPKALKIVELTPEEVKVHVGKSDEQLAEEILAEKAKAKGQCQICGGVFPNEHGLKIHVAKMHPDFSA
jgi:hypothetical protein